jgi:hypothetical protein
MTRGAEEYRRRYDLEERNSGWRFPGWLMTGLVVVGLGALAWYYIGADLRRYIRIHNM